MAIIYFEVASKHLLYKKTLHFKLMSQLGIKQAA